MNATRHRAFHGLALGFLTTLLGAACADEESTPSEAFAIGVPAPSQDGRLQIAFVAADPESPAVGTNDWTLHITDPQGDPVLGATVGVRGWMAAHGHGTNPASVPAEELGQGDYAVSDVRLFMPGRWTLTVEVTLDYVLTAAVWDVTLES